MILLQIMSIQMFFLILGLIFWIIAAIIYFVIIPKLEREKLEVRSCAIEDYDFEKAQEEKRLSIVIDTLEQVRGCCIIIGYISISIGSVLNGDDW